MRRGSVTTSKVRVMWGRAGGGPGYCSRESSHLEFNQLKLLGRGNWYDTVATAWGEYLNLEWCEES